MIVLRKTMGKFKHKNKNRVTNGGHKQDASIFFAVPLETKVRP
jgi:hypothetical protein